MSDIEILKLKSKGYCCSQILVALFLGLLEKENSELIAFTKGLCIGGGMVDGPCGILQCGISVLSMYCPNDKDKFLIMSDEFRDAFSEITGKKIFCGEILGDSFPEPNNQLCGSVLQNSYSRLTSILVKYEIDPTESPEYEDL